ncbi:MAG: hypothetical protein ACFNJI_07485, partial [Leptotrichia hongkongensis]
LDAARQSNIGIRREPRELHALRRQMRDIRKFIEKGMEVEIKDRFNNVVEMKSEFEKLDFKDI